MSGWLNVIVLFFDQEFFNTCNLFLTCYDYHCISDKLWETSKAKYSRLEIADFLKVERSYVVKVHKVIEAALGDSTAVIKHKTPAKDIVP